METPPWFLKCIDTTNYWLNLHGSFQISITTLSNTPKQLISLHSTLLQYLKSNDIHRSAIANEILENILVQEVDSHQTGNQNETDISPFHSLFKSPQNFSLSYFFKTLTEFPPDPNPTNQYSVLSFAHQKLCSDIEQVLFLIVHEFSFWQKHGGYENLRHFRLSWDQHLETVGDDNVVDGNICGMDDECMKCERRMGNDGVGEYVECNNDNIPVSTAQNSSNIVNDDHLSGDMLKFIGKDITELFRDEIEQNSDKLLNKKDINLKLINDNNDYNDDGFCTDVPHLEFYYYRSLLGEFGDLIRETIQPKETFPHHSDLINSLPPSISLLFADINNQNDSDTSHGVIRMVYDENGEANPSEYFSIKQLISSILSFEDRIQILDKFPLWMLPHPNSIFPKQSQNFDKSTTLKKISFESEQIDHWVELSLSQYVKQFYIVTNITPFSPSQSKNERNDLQYDSTNDPKNDPKTDQTMSDSGHLPEPIASSTMNQYGGIHVQQFVHYVLEDYLEMIKQSKCLDEFPLTQKTASNGHLDQEIETHNSRRNSFLFPQPILDPSLHFYLTPDSQSTPGGELINMALIASKFYTILSQFFLYTSRQFKDEFTSPGKSIRQPKQKVMVNPFAQVVDVGENKAGGDGGNNGKHELQVSDVICDVLQFVFFKHLNNQELNSKEYLLTGMVNKRGKISTNDDKNDEIILNEDKNDQDEDDFLQKDSDDDIIPMNESDIDDTIKSQSQDDTFGGNGDQNDEIADPVSDSAQKLPTLNLPLLSRPLISDYISNSFQFNRDDHIKYSNPYSNLTLDQIVKNNFNSQPSLFSPHFGLLYLYTRVSRCPTYSSRYYTHFDGNMGVEEVSGGGGKGYLYLPVAMMKSILTHFLTCSSCYDSNSIEKYYFNHHLPPIHQTGQFLYQLHSKQLEENMHCFKSQLFLTLSFYLTKIAIIYKNHLTLNYISSRLASSNPSGIGTNDTDTLVVGSDDDNDIESQIFPNLETDSAKGECDQTNNTNDWENARDLNDDGIESQKVLLISEKDEITFSLSQFNMALIYLTQHSPSFLQLFDTFDALFTSQTSSNNPQTMYSSIIQLQKADYCPSIVKYTCGDTQLVNSLPLFSLDNSSQSLFKHSFSMFFDLSTNGNVCNSKKVLGGKNCQFDLNLFLPLSTMSILSSYLTNPIQFNLPTLSHLLTASQVDMSQIIIVLTDLISSQIRKLTSSSNPPSPLSPFATKPLLISPFALIWVNLLLQASEKAINIEQQAVYTRFATTLKNVLTINNQIIIDLNLILTTIRIILNISRNILPLSRQELVELEQSFVEDSTGYDDIIEQGISDNDDIDSDHDDADHGDAEAEIVVEGPPNDSSASISINNVDGDDQQLTVEEAIFLKTQLTHSYSSTILLNKASLLVNDPANDEKLRTFKSITKATISAMGHSISISTSLSKVVLDLLGDKFGIKPV